MTDQNKVIAGLECHCDDKAVVGCRGACPYSWEDHCVDALLRDALECLKMMDDVRKDIWDVTNENHRLTRSLRVARVERDQAREKLARITGEREASWLSEDVHPNWYQRLSDLEYVYNPEPNGEPWYQAKDVWACIEEVADV